MRCWIVHKFGRWKTYKAVYEKRAVEVVLTPKPMSYTVAPELLEGTTTMEKPYTIIEDRQTRECVRCGYTQDMPIGAK